MAFTIVLLTNYLPYTHGIRKWDFTHAHFHVCQNYQFHISNWVHPKILDVFWFLWDFSQISRNPWRLCGRSDLLPLTFFPPFIFFPLGCTHFILISFPSSSQWPTWWLSEGLAILFSHLLAIVLCKSFIIAPKFKIGNLASYFFLVFVVFKIHLCKWKKHSKWGHLFFSL